MAFLDQSASNTSLLASVTATFGATPKAGNLLVAAVTASVATGSISITGWSSGNSIAVGVAGGLVIFYKVAGAAESTTVTANGTLAVFMDIHIFEYAGIDNASPIDKTATTADGGSGVTSRASGTTATTSQANELLFVAVGMDAANGNNASWSNSFNAEITTTHLITSDLSVSATGTYSSTGTWTNSARAAGAIITFLGETGDSYAAKTLLKPRIPTINWENPITKGLFINIPFFEKGGLTTLETINKITGTITGATWISDIYGPALSFAGGASTNNVVITRTIQVLRSVEVYFYYKATDATARRLWDWTNNDLFLIDNTPRFQYQPNWSTSSAAYMVTTPSANAWHHLIITYDGGSAANNAIIYLDGVAPTVTKSGTNTGSLNGGTSALTIGNTAAVNRCWNGYILYYNRWNRILNAQEAKQLYTNPWQIYTQPGLLYNQSL